VSDGSPIRFFCLSEHRRGVREELLRIGCRIATHDLCSIDGDHDVARMQGIREGTFVLLSTHPRQLPPVVREFLELYGWRVIKFDDTYARALYRRSRCCAD
jgi:hypothetical protein